MKIAVVGGGSTYTPELIDGILKLGGELGVREVALIDVDAGREKMETVAGLARRMVESHGSPLVVTTGTDLQAGITGAAAVINQFRVGGFEARANDERIPLSFGLIGQETTGVGGMMKALRTLPVLDAVVEAVRKHTDQAWIINFTNPAGLNTEYLVNFLDYPRTIGLCNVPIEFVLKAADILGCTREEVFLDYYGLNHLSWVSGVRQRGMDRTDEFWQSFSPQMKNNPDIEFQPGFYQMLRLLPNPYLEYYYNSGAVLAKLIRSRDETGTRAEQIMRLEPELLKLYSEPERTVIPDELAERGGFMYSTVAVELLRDLFTDAGVSHIVNTRNGGAVPNLPDDYILEIPASIGANGAATSPVVSAHAATIGLIHTIKQFERLTIAAHVAGDETKAKQAMLIHPLGPDETQLDALWTALSNASAEYLGTLSRRRAAG